MISTTFDVLIVGTGLSGLQAALDLHAAGKSFIILEARDRVGGKTRTIARPDGKGNQELGAAWVNDTNQSLAWSYVEQFNLTPVVQNIQGSVACEDVDGSCHFFPFGGLPDFDKTDVDDITALRDVVEAASLDEKTYTRPNRLALDQISFEQWCRNAGAGQRALQTATLWCRGTIGQEPCEVSALAFLEIARGGHGIINLRYDGKHGAQHLRLREGTQAISTNMVELLPPNSILFQTAAISIRQDSSGSYTTITNTGTAIKSLKVIISIPGPAYKNIKFSPPLPSQKQIYTQSARYGTYVKYICFFKTPFWRRKGSCGLAQSFRGPINHCRDTSVDTEENYALTCFLASTPARRWLTLNTEDRHEALLRQIGPLFAVGYDAVKAEYLGCAVSEWMEDEFAGWGCPFAVPPPGTRGAESEDGSWPGISSNGLFFIGTELTNEWRGYMEGALRSGKRGARQAIDALSTAI